MATITVDQLIGLLPNVDLHVMEGACDGVQNITTPAPFFVAPELAIKVPLKTGQTSLLLIEAPAAVGKTMLAEAISHRTGGSLWNLAAFNVGDDTFVGRIGKCFGDELYSTIMNRLAQGDFLVILDALDEGRLRAGDDNFLAFLKTLAERLNKPRQRPCVIVLGRPESIELAALSFDDHTFAHLEIEFFEREAANDLIAKQLDSLCTRDGLARLHRQHRQAFAKARDMFFERAVEVLGARARGGEISWNNPAVRSFLGYAPVLVAVAKYLATVDEAHEYRVLEDNLRETKVSAGPTAAWELFGNILDGILEREQRKACDVIKPRLTAAAAKSCWAAWETLYTATEQRLRLLSRGLNHHRKPKRGDLGIQDSLFPAGLDPELRDEYEKAIRDHLPDHPFLMGKGPDGFAGEVFRDDTYAWALDSNDVTAQQKERVRSRLGKMEKFSPIFAQSLLARAGSRCQPPQVPQVRAADLGFVYDSLASSFQKSHFRLYEREDDEWMIATFQDVAERIQDLTLHVSPVGGQVLFPRHLINANINVSGGVALGVEGFAFYLGPNVELTSSVLEINGDVTVQTGNVEVREEHRHVILEALECVHGQKAPRVDGQGLLTTQWQNPRYPWERFALQPKPDDNDIAEFGEELVKAIRTIGIRGWSFLNLEDSKIAKEFPITLRTKLESAGILGKPRLMSASGHLDEKPSVNSTARSILMRNPEALAKWQLPDEIRLMLRAAGHGGSLAP